MIENLVTAVLVIIAAAYLAVRIKRSFAGRPCECKAEKCPSRESTQHGEKCPHARGIINDDGMS